MVGKDYASYGDFIEACRTRDEPLHTSGVLGKIYSIEQLKSLADFCGFNHRQVVEIGEKSQEIDNRMPKGILKRYCFAEGIAQVATPQQIGEALAYQDHKHCFPVATYLLLTDMMRASMDRISETLRTSYDIGPDNFKAMFNGITQPAGASCELESIHIDTTDQIISLLFSCSRVLLLPDGRHGSFEDYFLARVPILVRLIFPLGLLEISMPTFSDVVGVNPEWSNTVPERYQTIVVTLLARIKTIISGEFTAVDFKKVTLFLETRFQTTDMGWKIEPQAEATFDFTQGAVPLKKILEVLSNSLKDECRRRRLPFPLERTNLYNVFRALKEQSYTYSLLLQGPLGRLGGTVKASTLYGRPNTGYLPIIMLDKNDRHISDKLREAVCRSQLEEIENPYDLDSIFQSHDT